MNSTATCYTRRKSFIPFFKDWWQIVSLISSCIVRTLRFFSDILRVPTAVCVSGSIHQTVHGDCTNIQRRVSQHRRDSERDCLSLTHFSLGNVGLSWHMSENVLILTLSTFIYARILFPPSLSITRTQADSNRGVKKDDNAIYSQPCVPDLPIKHRSQKGSREGDKTQSSEALRRREHLWDLTHKRRVLAPELSLYVSRKY